MELKFGTSGLRGLASDLTSDVCDRYVGAFLALIASQSETPKSVCIGMDLRPSSAAIAAACAAAATSRGVAVINGGEAPTPAIAHYALARGLPALMITASHNPVEHNGIKFYRPDGELMKSDEAPMHALLGQIGVPRAGGCGDLPVVETRVLQEYISSYTSVFPRDALQGLRLGVDQHSAVGRDLLVEVLEALGATCVVVRRSDSFIAVDTEALSATYTELARGWIEAEQGDAIVSTDGDGDRPLILDATGRQILGDTIGILAAHYLGYEHVVTPVSSSLAVNSSGWFRSVTRTRIGSPFVIEAMRAELASGAPSVAGFEGNGGFLTGGSRVWRGLALTPLMTRDAILPIIALLAMAREERASLADLTLMLPRRAKATGRVANIDAARAQVWINELVAVPSALPQLVHTAKVETLDGAKFLLDDGSSLHFRLSGNAPELRCYVECDSLELARIGLDQALAQARQALG